MRDSEVSIFRPFNASAMSIIAPGYSAVIEHHIGDPILPPRRQSISTRFGTYASPPAGTEIIMSPVWLKQGTTHVAAYRCDCGAVTVVLVIEADWAGRRLRAG